MSTDVLPAPDVETPWSAAHRAAFRALFVYLILYQTEGVLGLVAPVFRLLGSPIGPRALYAMPWDRAAAWIGVHVFSIDARLLAPVGGSTDSALNYVRTALFVFTALLVCSLWSGLTNAREHVAPKRHLDDFVRYALAMSLFFYGVNKVIPVQMLPGQLVTTGLVREMGAKSPAGLLWAFVGYSIPYQMIAGAVELGSALLLLTRRTAPLGALGAVVATMSVFVLNMCYDVNLKLYSLNLLLAAIFLAWPVLSLMWRLFIMRQPVTPTPVIRSPRRGGLASAGRIAFVALWVVYGYQTVTAAFVEYKRQWDGPASTPLYGVYEVQDFRRNAADVPPLLTDTSRWRRIIMESPTVVQVQAMNDSFQTYQAKYEPAASRLDLFAARTATPTATFRWSFVDADHVQLDGRFGADHLTLTLHRENVADFPLFRRRFHWIQQTRTAVIE